VKEEMSNQTGLRNTVLALCVAAVVMLAVSLAVTVPVFLSSGRVTQAYPAPPPTGAEALGERAKMAAFLTAFQGGEQVKAINVVGVGTVKAKPDRAVVDLSVITRGDTAVEAYQLNAEKMNMVIAALKEAGIPENSMETTGYSLNPVWSYPKGEEPVIVGYECRNSLKVTLEDLSMVGEVIDRGVKAGANRVSSVSFTLSEQSREKLKVEALSLAVKDAKAKAETIAEAAGVTLVGPTSISLSSVPTPTPVIYKEAAFAGAAAPPQIIAPEELSVTVNVSVVYEFK